MTKKSKVDMNIANMFTERISAGLARKSLTSCSKWAEKYRMMGKPFPGPWRFTHFPWLKDMHDSKADMNIGKKAAQMGFTEVLLNWTFFNIDINRESVLYVLPTDDNAGDFSATRFDPALENSKHLNNMFSNVKNTKLKRAGNATLYIRGSRSQNKLISVPVGKIALDEVDRMVLNNIPMIWERMSGQIEKQNWLISTPTVPELGIDSYYIDSSKEHSFFKCPHCSRHIELDFPDNLVITAEDKNDPRIKDTHLVCNKCKTKLVHETKLDWLKTDWVPETKNDDIRGFYINQLYSHTLEPWRFALAYLKSLTNPADEQEFHNQKCGKAHLVDGAKVEDSDIKAVIKGYENKIRPNKDKIVTMGVDVGTWLHVEIDEWHLDKYGTDIHDSAEPKVIYIGKVVDFEELDILMKEYNVLHCVIDANPERRKAQEFCNRMWGMASMCFYGNAQKGKSINKGIEMPTVTVDRTSWLDLSLGRFTSEKKRISLPINTQLEYKDHIKAQVKVYEKDADGNPVAHYINGGKDDHYGHARNYAEIALSCVAVNANGDIDNY